MRRKTICFPPPRQEHTPHLTRLESFGFIIIRSAHWQASKDATNCKAIVAAASKRLCGRQLQSVTVTLQTQHERKRSTLASFFLYSKDKNTPLPCSSVQNSKFTPLSSSSSASEQIVAPPRILTSLCNFGCTTSISTSICWGFEVSNPFSGLFWVHTIRLLDNCTFTHCKICSSIVFIRHLMRRSCEGDDKTSKEMRLQVKIIKKKEIKKCNI